jgi:hypothetical protein
MRPENHKEVPMSETVSMGEGVSEKIVVADWRRLGELAEGLAIVVDEAWRLWLRLPEPPDSVDHEATAATLREVAGRLPSSPTISRASDRRTRFENHARPLQ